MKWLRLCTDVCKMVLVTVLILTLTPFGGMLSIYRFLKGANRCHRCGLEWPGLAMPMVEVAGRCGDVPSTSTYHERQETLVAYCIVDAIDVLMGHMTGPELKNVSQHLPSASSFWNFLAGVCCLGLSQAVTWSDYAWSTHGVRRSRRKTEGGRVAELWDIVKEHASE